MILPALFLLAIVCILLFLSLLWVPWRVHLDMMRQYGKSNARGTYEDFMREFGSRLWTRDEYYPNSYFAADRSGDEIHASILIFGTRGMVMGMLDWARVELFLRKTRIRVSMGKLEPWV